MCVVIILMLVVLVAFNRLYIAEGFWELLLKCTLFLGLAFITAVGGFHLMKPDYYREVSAKVMRRFRKNT